MRFSKRRANLLNAIRDCCDGTEKPEALELVFKTYGVAKVKQKNAALLDAMYTHKEDVLLEVNCSCYNLSKDEEYEYFKDYLFHGQWQLEFACEPSLKRVAAVYEWNRVDSIWRDLKKYNVTDIAAFLKRYPKKKGHHNYNLEADIKILRDFNDVDGKVADFIQWKVNTCDSQQS